MDHTTSRAEHVIRKCHIEADRMSKLLGKEEVKVIIKRQSDADSISRDIRKRLANERKRFRVEEECMKKRTRSNDDAASKAVDHARCCSYWANCKTVELNEARQWYHAEKTTSDYLAARLSESERRLSETERTLSDKERMLFEYSQRYGPLPSVSLSVAAKHLGDMK
jgi:hypothetical protein